MNSTIPNIKTILQAFDEAVKRHLEKHPDRNAYWSKILNQLLAGKSPTSTNVSDPVYLSARCGLLETTRVTVKEGTSTELIPYLVLHSGWLALLYQDIDSAEKELVNALKAFPNDPRLNYLIAQVYLYKGRAVALQNTAKRKPYYSMYLTAIEYMKRTVNAKDKLDFIPLSEYVLLATYHTMYLIDLDGAQHYSELMQQSIEEITKDPMSVKLISVTGLNEEMAVAFLWSMMTAGFATE